MQWLPLVALACSGYDALNLTRFERALTVVLMTCAITA